MRILLDENLDWRLGRDLPGHRTESVPLIGWTGIQNGELLAKAAEARFDVLLTMDSNMAYQQNIKSCGIAVIACARARIDWVTLVRSWQTCWSCCQTSCRAQ